MICIGAAGYMLFDVAMLGVCFAAFGNDVPPAGVLLVAYIVGQLGGLIPIPGGIGGVDGGLIGTLVLYGVDPGDAAVAVIAYRGLLLAIPAILGLPALAVLRKRLRVRRTTSPPAPPVRRWRCSAAARCGRASATARPPTDARQPGAAARSVASKSVRGTGRCRARWRRRPGSARRRRGPRRSSPIAVSMLEEVVGDRRLHRLAVACSGGRVEGRDVVPEARALDHRAVEGQREVGEQVAAQRVDARSASSVTAAGTAATMSKPSSVLPARSRPFVTSGTTTSRMYSGLHSQSITPSAISPARRSIAGGERGDVDRQVGARVVAHEVEAGVEVLARAAGPRRARIARTIADVLAHLGDRLVDRLAVPALDHRPVRDAEARGIRRPPRQLVDRGRRLRHCRRRARVDREHAGPEPDALACQPRRRSAR